MASAPMKEMNFEGILGEPQADPDFTFMLVLHLNPKKRESARSSGAATANLSCCLLARLK